MAIDQSGVRPAISKWIVYSFWASMSALGFTVLLLVIVGQTPPPVTSTPAEFTGPTYDFTTAIAFKRLSIAVPELASAASTVEPDDRGLVCNKRTVGGDQWRVCSAKNGQVYDVSVHVRGDGTIEARQLTYANVEAFMSLFESEPYTAVDRKRIHRNVAEALFEDRSTIERLDQGPRYVAMDIWSVAVEPFGSSYTFTATVDKGPWSQ